MSKFMKKSEPKTTAEKAQEKVAANQSKYKKIAATEDKKAAETAKQAAKAEKAKPAKAAKESKQEDSRKITLLVKENPKREGTAAHKAFELYKKSKTVQDFIKAGGSTADLRYDSAKEYIKVA